MTTRGGLSAVYGFLVLYLLIMAGLGAISNVAGTQTSLDQSVQRAAQIGAQKSTEHLSVQYFNGSVLVSNDGSTLSDLEYLVFSSGSGMSFSLPLKSQLPVGGNETFRVPSGSKDMGVLTGLGNLFWDDQGSGSSLSSCGRGTSTLNVEVMPAGSGFTNPTGVLQVCTGQKVVLVATALSGYAFSAWTGSYAVRDDPASMAVNGSMSEVAHFVPSLSILSIVPASDGVASGGPARTSTLELAGPRQTANLTVQTLPQGVSISFDPSTAEVEPTGANVTMHVSFDGDSYGVFSIPISVVGADGQRANTTYTLQTTPPDGSYLGSGTGLSANGLGYPMESKIAYWKGVYFFAFVAATARSEFVAFLPLYYSSGWTAGAVGDLGPVPFSGQDLAIAQGSSNLLLKTAVPYDGPDLCYDTGVVAGASSDWQYTGAGCEGQETPTQYYVVGYASALIDASSNWWSAVETRDSQGNARLEVLTASNGAWSDSYLSPPFATGLNPVPQLLQLRDGRVVVLYSLASGSSDCTGGDYFLYTDDAGYSWSQVKGPFSISSSPLCYEKSSGAVVGDTLYAGGVDAAGDLGLWSYNFDDSSSDARTLASGVTYAALGSTGTTLTLGYTTTTGCAGQESLHLMWSYDGGVHWDDSGIIGCVHGYVLLASSLSTFQVAMLSDIQVAGGISPEYTFYTV